MLMEAMAYPIRLVGLVVSDVVTIGLAMFLWMAVFSQRGDVGGYDLMGMASYYLVTLALKNFTLSDRTADTISEAVRAGSLSAFLVKPVSYPRWVLVQVMAEKLIRSVGPICLILGLVWGLGFPLKVPPSPGLFLVSLLLASVMNFLLAMLIGSIAFWSVDTDGFVSIIYRSVNILNGGIFPLDLLPKWLGTISGVLPFRYMHYVVVAIALGRLSGEAAMIQIGWQGVWLGILAIVYKLVWKRGIRQYESIGI